MRKLRRMRKYQYIFLALFFALLISSVLFVIVRYYQVTFALLLISFPTAMAVAIYGSLAIREEEEETS